MPDGVEELISFIRDTYRTNGSIPLHEPVFTGNEKRYVVDSIESTFVSPSGPYVDRLEEMMVEISQTRKAVAVVNGTAALQVSLRLVGVKQDDEVITQAFTFVGTANAIAYNGAEPVFLDVDLDSMGLSPDAVRNFLEEFGELRNDGCFNRKTGKRISACVPMHSFGFPVHLAALLEVCDQWHIPLVEDAAESLGSMYHDRPTGSFGRFGIYSFNGNKIVTAGGGGAIVTLDEIAGEFARHLTTTARVSQMGDYAHDELGYNFRMPNLNAALLCAQLEQLGQFLRIKRKLAERYAGLLKGKEIQFRTEQTHTRANYWLMCVELENREARDFFLETTNRAGIKTQSVWRLMFRLPMYQHCYRDGQKNAMYLQDHIVNIPSSVYVEN